MGERRPRWRVAPRLAVAVGAAVLGVFLAACGLNGEGTCSDSCGDGAVDGTVDSTLDSGFGDIRVVDSPIMDTRLPDGPPPPPPDAPEGGVCTTSANCPMGEACNPSTHQCSTSCAGGLTCHGGCCAGNMCQPGTAPNQCGSGGGACTMCGGMT